MGTGVVFSLPPATIPKENNLHFHLPKSFFNRCITIEYWETAPRCTTSWGSVVHSPLLGPTLTVTTVPFSPRSSANMSLPHSPAQPECSPMLILYAAAPQGVFCFINNQRAHRDCSTIFILGPSSPFLSRGIPAAAVPIITGVTDCSIPMPPLPRAGTLTLPHCVYLGFQHVPLYLGFQPIQAPLGL